MAVSEMTTIRWSLLDDIAHLQAEGVQAVGLWRRKITEFGEERAVDLVRESGMAVASLSSAGGFTGHGGHSFRSAIDDALDALKLAAQLQAGSLVLVAGARAGHTRRHARALLVDALCELGAAAAQWQVPLALLPMHPQVASASSFVTTLDEALDVVREVAHPMVGLAFDVFQLSHTPDLPGRVDDALPFIKTVQLSDRPQAPRCANDRVLPGEGVLPLVDLVDRLESRGYRGFYDLEIWSEELWKQDYVRLVQRSREAFRALAPGRPWQPIVAEA